MKTYNIQYRNNQELFIKTVGANSLEEAKQKVVDTEGIKPHRVLKDEAIL